MKKIKDTTDAAILKLLTLIADIRPDQAPFVSGPKIKEFFLKSVRREFSEFDFDVLLESVQGMLTFHEGPIYLATTMNWIRKFKKILDRRAAEASKVPMDEYMKGKIDG